MEHLHSRVSATGDEWFEHFPEHFFRVDLIPAYTKNMIKNVFESHVFEADTQEWRCFIFTLKNLLNCFYSRCFISQTIHSNFSSILSSLQNEMVGFLYSCGLFLVFSVVFTTPSLFVSFGGFCSRRK